MKIVRVYSGDDGESHFEELEIPLTAARYGQLSEMVEAQGVIFRETPVGGALEITAPEPDRERDGDVLVFDPTRVTDGIELSGDRILNFRPDAYAVSVFRRTGVSRDG